MVCSLRCAALRYKWWGRRRFEGMLRSLSSGVTPVSSMVLSLSLSLLLLLLLLLCCSRCCLFALVWPPSHDVGTPSGDMHHHHHHQNLTLAHTPLSCPLPVHALCSQECMTYSVGFRAPSARDLVTFFGDHAASTATKDGEFYQDPDLQRQESHGRAVKETEGGGAGGGNVLGDRSRRIFFLRRPQTPPAFRAYIVGAHEVS